MRSDDLNALPAGLPVPVDDGACDHLRGAVVPAIALPCTRGGMVRLDQIAFSFMGGSGAPCLRPPTE